MFTSHRYRLFLPLAVLRLWLYCNAWSGDLSSVGKNPPTEEILIQIDLQRLATRDVTAQILGEKLYLPVGELFSFLRIKADFSPDRSRVRGFFLREENRYSIDVSTGLIVVGGRQLQGFREDFVVGATDLYVSSALLARAFGLHTEFDYRALRAILRSEHPLPIVREQQRKEARRRLKLLTGTPDAERTLPMQRRMLSGAVLDWNLQSSLSRYGSFHAYRAGIGAALLGGDLELYVTGNDQTGIARDQLRGRWRFVFPARTTPVRTTESGEQDNPFLQQILIGDVRAEYGPETRMFELRGVQLTNRPAVLRKIYGSYVLAERTEPGWEVELYRNGELVDVTTAGPDGSYQFEVPLSYGSTQLQLKFYGPLGEERSSEKLVQIPFTLVPTGTVDYSLTAGLLRSLMREPFGEGLVRWGLSSRVTLGAGVQAIGKDARRSPSPFVVSSMRLSDALLFSAEYAHRRAAGGTLYLLLPSQLMVETSYFRFSEDPFFNPAGKSEERRILFSYPLRSSWITFTPRMSLRETIFGNYSLLYGETGFSTSLPNFQLAAFSRVTWVRARLTAAQAYGPLTPQTMLTQLSGSVRILRGSLSIRPQVEFDHLQRTVSRMGITADYRIGSAFWAGVTVERGLTWQATRTLLNLRLDLSFAQMYSTVHSYAQNMSVTQSAYGTIAFDAGARELVIGNRSWVSRGGITVGGFLDLNGNGWRDEGEPSVPNLQSTLRGSYTLSAHRYRPSRFLELEPYATYLVSVDPQSLDNLLWRPRYTSVVVTVQPNEFRFVSVPIIATGEVGGRVVLKTDATERGLADIRVLFEQIEGRHRAECTTSSTGEYTLIGLPAGRYRAFVDRDQLARLSIAALPDTVLFTVYSKPEGDIVEGIDFELRPAVADRAVTSTLPMLKESTREKIAMPERPAKTLLYTLQVGAFSNRTHAQRFADLSAYRAQTRSYIGYDQRQRLYKVWIGRYEEERSLTSTREFLRRHFPEDYASAFAVPLVDTAWYTEPQTFRRVLPEEHASSVFFGVRVGAFKEADQAMKLLADARRRHPEKLVYGLYDTGKSLYKVFVGRTRSSDGVIALMRELFRQKGGEYPILLVERVP